MVMMMVMMEDRLRTPSCAVFLAAAKDPIHPVGKHPSPVSSVWYLVYVRFGTCNCEHKPNARRAPPREREGVGGRDREGVIVREKERVFVRELVVAAGMLSGGALPTNFPRPDRATSPSRSPAKNHTPFQPDRSSLKTTQRIRKCHHHHLR